MQVEAGIAVPVPSDVTVPEANRVRVLAEILRGILVAALAAAIVGAVVGGLGGRIVMRLAALIDPTSAGFRTDNGNVIGDITLDGTLALVMFGGLLLGLLASVLWVIVAPWLPGTRAAQAISSGILAVAFASGFVVDSRNPDFAILDHDLVIVAILLAIPALFGLILPATIRRIDRRVPHPGPDPRQFTLVAGGLVLLGGILFVPFTAGIYVTDRACLCSVAPIPLGVPLVIAGLATLATWVAAIRGSALPPAVAIVGRAAVLVAGVLGLAILVREIDRIPG
jgi:hypothetical protein